MLIEEKLVYTLQIISEVVLEANSTGVYLMRTIPHSAILLLG